MIPETGSKRDFKRAMLKYGLPPLPRLGEYYRSSASGEVFVVAVFAGDWMELVGVHRDTEIASGLYGIYEDIVYGHLVRCDE